MTVPALDVRSVDPALRNAWDLPVGSARHVDSRRIEALARLGISTIGDLLRHYPFRYLDLTATMPIRDVPLGSEATVVGHVRDIRLKKPRPRLSIVEIAIADDSGVVVGVWFNQPYMAKRFSVDDRIAMAGRMEMDFGLRQMRSPFVERMDAAETPEELGRVLPVYRATEGLSTNWLRRLIADALLDFGAVPDPIPSAIRVRRGLAPYWWAVGAIHFPRQLRDVDEARRRLAYEEHLLLQTAVAVRRHRIVDLQPGYAHCATGTHVAALRASLPFTLTADQSTAISEVLADMQAPSPMNRMVLGDVGTGKTVVAAFALALTADSGTQAAMMAPTEVLAHQYATSMGPLLDAAGVTWALLTGSTSQQRRREILKKVSSGEISVLLGTHALIQQDVSFKRLTLAVVDEQHRFGVQQRLRLRSKGPAVDLLVMTATPIPRSLALTHYGDLDTSFLRTRPANRPPDHVRTVIVPHARRAEAYETVRNAVRQGRQAYVVCALVEEGDSPEARAANREAERLQSRVFPDLRVGLLTGKMRPGDKQRVMALFREGAIDVLVATTVIEVGIDVPNATVMIVENGERYGLAQLHQLRGRIGRGEHPGLFLVFADPKTDEGRQRMEAIARTDDGFALAEEDLRLRGEGEILGSRQSGLPQLHVASLVDDEDLLLAARADARELVSVDPDLMCAQNAPLGHEVRAILADTGSAVSSG
ncbi:MAG: ATP-dependent DNA helicase RecG [Coriobacteriales bacterium]